MLATLVGVLRHGCSASCSPSRRRAAGCGRRWLTRARRRRAAAAGLAAVHHRRSRSSSRSGRKGFITTTCSASTTSRVYGFWSTLLAETLTYFPIAYLTLRPILAAIDPNLEEMALQPRRLALAHLPHRHPAARRAGLRQRLPAAVRRLARRLRDAADPGRQQLPGAADAGLPADHRHVRPQGRRRAVADAAGAGARRLPAAALLGRPPHLRHRHRQGRPALAPFDAIAPWARGAARRGCVAGRASSSSISTRCCSTPRWSWRSAPTTASRWQHYQRDLHRGPAGDPRHADHRRDRHAARRPLRRAGRLPDRAQAASPAGARWSSCR